MAYIRPDEFNLFSALPSYLQACPQCYDTGLIWRLATNQLGFCQSHPSAWFNEVKQRPEIRVLYKWSYLRYHSKNEFSPLRFDIAKILTCYTSAEPCKGDQLQKFVTGRGVAVNTERYVKLAIESLREEWLMPIASRRGGPAGYWFARSNEELAEWSKQNAQPAVTALRTNRNVLRANSPLFGGQHTFDFLKFIVDGVDAGPEAKEAA